MEMKKDFSGEFQFAASRSGGPGGQNVNKVSTKIELRININDSKLLNEEEKEIIRQKLAARINSEGELIIVSQSERSQLGNKEKAIDRFYQIIDKALTPPRKRIKSTPTKASIEKRLKEKQILSQRKADRRDTGLQ